MSCPDGPPNGTRLLWLNEAIEPFGSKDVRQPISLAIDCATLSHAVWFDTTPPFDTIFNPTIWTSDAG